MLAAAPAAYLAVKLAGACHLVFLGTQSLWHSRRTAPAPVGTHPRPTGGSPWRTGLVGNVLNPKNAVFFRAPPRPAADPAHARPGHGRRTDRLRPRGRDRGRLTGPARPQPRSAAASPAPTARNARPTVSSFSPTGAT
ncbi:hypothetical protein [Streptomyces sp. NPDC050534]|uniref:hypothetical protein n=1 Tax=Streptomyces sp. NPDC050534 TaxID=3365625 RepID=UPI0037A68007